MASELPLDTPWPNRQLKAMYRLEWLAVFLDRHP
jgi:hypothetical protein